MKIGIYAPYLDSFGGGEKYICKIAETLSENNEVVFIGFKEIDLNELKRRLNINLNKITITTYKCSNCLYFKLPFINRLIKNIYISKTSKNYDLFINQEHFSTIPAYAKKNFLIKEVPTTEPNNLHWIYNTPIINILFDFKLVTYNKIITNSNYTKEWIEKIYEKDIKILYPPSERFIPLNKENIIISVGRFFEISHCKKQFEMIRAFKQLYENNENLNDWEYHLVGGVDSNPKNQMYLKKCIEEADSYPIHFHVNSTFKDLEQLYGKSKIFWHATGLEENEHQHPERMEHFGITTVEAMSSGCVPVTINKGGQPEIVRNRTDGFLWNTVEELKEYTLELIDNKILLGNMSQEAIKRSQKFQIEQFKENMNDIFQM